MGEILGRGGFATVHVASEKDSPTLYAAKVVDRRSSSDWALGKLQSEIETLELAQAHARHPSIVRFYGAAVCSPFHVLCFEALGPDCLELVLEDKGLGEQRGATIVWQLLNALSHLQLYRICHGDIKPENLLCDPHQGIQQIRLADFGSALQLPECGTASVDTVAQGTTLYSPPEVLQTQAYSCAADMWATGITAYVLISGFFPFGTASDALTHQASFSGGRWGAGGDMATPREKLARCFVSSLLQHDPGERPGPGAAIQHEWLRRACMSTPPQPRPKPAKLPALPPLSLCQIGAPSEEEVRIRA